MTRKAQKCRMRPLTWAAGLERAQGLGTPMIESEPGVEGLGPFIIAQRMLRGLLECVCCLSRCESLSEILTIAMSSYTDHE